MSNDDYWVTYAKWSLGEISDRDFAEYLRERYKDDDPAAEILIAILMRSDESCSAFIWNGPGHQSKAPCEVKGPHQTHRAIVGDRVLEWEGDEGVASIFDSSPEALA